MTSGLWAKIAVDYADDPKIVRAGIEGEVLFVRSVCWCKKQNNGFIPDVLLTRIGMGLNGLEQIAERLVAVGLWQIVDDGWFIPKFDEWQSANPNTSEKAQHANHLRWHKKTPKADCIWCSSQSSHCDPNGNPFTIPREEKSREETISATSADAQKMCDLLAQKMVANGCKPPNITRKWIDDMDKIMRIDGHTAEEVESVIMWCQQDSFWCSNILSPSKLRTQFDALKLRMPKQETPQPEEVRDPDFKCFEDGLVDWKIGLELDSELVQSKLAGMTEHQQSLYLQGFRGMLD
jgi:hypothetical protein